MLLGMVSSTKLCMNAARFPFHFSLFHLLILLVSVQSDCPSFFRCGDLGDFGFPLSNYTHPECGLVKVECDIRPRPKIYLQNEWFSPNEWFSTSEILGKLSSNRLYVRNLHMYEFLMSEDLDQKCKAFDNYSSPNTSSISFSFFPNISLLICDKNVNLSEFQRYRNYTGCQHFDVYYTIPNDALVPRGCSRRILPFNSSSNSDDLFNQISFEYALEWTVSDKCIDCRRKGGLCTTDPSNDFRCDKAKSRVKLIVLLTGVSLIMVAFSIILFTFPWRKYMLKGNMQNNHNIEVFLEKHGNLAPRRYKYSNLKKMTNSFSDKLGEGGFGSVYKGKLPEGHVVAVKILKEPKENGEEFINEVASISRTSHVNVVNLLGFCFEGSKRALIYEFMPNGSLEKFIYSNGSLTKCQLGWEKLFQIAVGIARGIEYLHQGCNMRILHFDIKPHNILLDKDFNPKISDFGLSKLCPNRSSIVSILGARGTIGYIAPELVCRNIGEVSHKSDVYSYGMMVLEMVGERKNIDVEVDRTSEIYFPHWIYKHLEHNAELNLNRVSNEDELLTIRKMIIVGLWCIQTDPTIRPSMTKVVEMLEGNMESLQIPPKPYLSSPPRQEVNSPTSELALTSLL